MNSNSEHIDRLITRYFSGEALPDEALELEQWIDQAPENKKYFEGFRFLADHISPAGKYVKVDTGNAWKKVAVKMRKTKEAAADEGKVIPLYKNRWFRLAASVLLIIGLLAGFIGYFSGQSRFLPRVTIASTDSIINRQVTRNMLVSLNRNSNLYCLTNKTGRKNKLKLTGEAFFEVRHASDTVIIVQADETFIRDIGTSFNVKAYPGNRTVEVYVESGLVAFYTKDQKGIILKKGETGIYDKYTREFSVKIFSGLNITAYKTRNFVFRNEKLSDVIKALNEIYPQKIHLADSKLADYPITVTFKNEPIDSLVAIMAETMEIYAEKDSSGFILYTGEGQNH